MASLPGPSPSDDRPASETEVEWQFDALDLRPVERWLAALPLARPVGPSLPPMVTAQAGASRRLVDRYVDTEDWRLARAGFVLRTRRRARRDEATLKDTRPSDPTGLRQRLEVTEPLAGGSFDGLSADGPVGRRVRAVAGRRALRPVLEVRTRRRPYALRVAGEEVGEVALDETQIDVGPAERPVSLQRVEVEVDPAWVDRLAPLVADLQSACGLQPASLSKFEAGLLALGVTVPGPPDLGPTDVGPDATFGQLAYAMVRRHLAVLIAKEPGTRLGEDIEELHDMRVATRRLRAALDLFTTALPARAAWLRDELRWLAGVLGAVRDLDVQIERMDEPEWTAEMGGPGGSPLDELRARLESERDDARQALADALDSARYERLVAGLTSMVQRPPVRPPVAARVAAVAVVPELVDERHRAVTKAAKRARRSGVATDFHRLRKRGKRLRYSLEFTAPLYGGRAERFARVLAKLQDALGLMQDAAVATERLRTLATEAGSPLSPATVFAMGEVAERYRAEAADLLATMPHRLKVLKGKEWDDLAAVMEERLGEAAVPARRPATARPSTAVAAGPAPTDPPPTETAAAAGTGPGAPAGIPTGDPDPGGPGEAWSPAGPDTGLGTIPDVGDISVAGEGGAADQPSPANGTSPAAGNGRAPG